MAWSRRCWRSRLLLILILWVQRCGKTGRQRRQRSVDRMQQLLNTSAIALISKSMDEIQALA